MVSDPFDLTGAATFHSNDEKMESDYMNRYRITVDGILLQDSMNKSRKDHTRVKVEEDGSTTLEPCE